MALLFIIFFATSPSSAQSGLTLNVTTTDETCQGNGTLTFNVSGADPNYPVTYTVYQLPDTINPIAFQTSNFLGGRSAGTYRVIAEQVIEGNSVSQTVDVVINSNITPFSYEITSTPAICGNDGVMQINVLSGTGTQYEIISGPTIRPLQPSPTFGSLPAGVYVVRAFNDCNVGTVITHTLISDSVQITIGEVSFPNNELPSCNQIFVGNAVAASANDDIPFPLTVTYTIHPPNGGADIIINDIVNGTGPVFDLSTIIPFWHAQSYSYDLVVIDGCGNTWTRNNNVVHQQLGLTLMPTASDCGEYVLTLSVVNYFPPIMVEIQSAPSGFDADALNPVHPGPFSSGDITYGDNDNPVPFGDYTIKITDGCGHTAVGQTTIIEIPVEPIANVQPYPGCESGESKVIVEIPGHTIVSAVVQIAPTAYPQTLPDDVSEFIDEEEGLILEHLPAGFYSVHLIDECGIEYDAEFTVPPMVTSASFSTRPDCVPGTASIRVRGNSTILTSVIVTSAPSGFPYPIPFDGTALINAEGIFSMSGVPPGNYSFTTTNNCGQTNPLLNQFVTGYSVSVSNVSVTKHCGAFDVTLEHTSNGVSQSFWLQEFDTVSGTWGHPDTGVPYPDGTWPDTTNSLPLLNNFTTLNLTFLGTFRVIKRMESFPNGGSSEEYPSCIEVLHEFTFDGQFEITGFEKLSCDGTLADIKVLTDALPPLIFRIVEKDGSPFFIDNGSNNVFTGLEPAVYLFEVEQFCGDIESSFADVAELPSAATATQPQDIVICDDASNDGVEQFDLSAVNDEILTNQDTDNYNITYYSSADDAGLSQNALPSTITSGSKTIYVRLDYINNPVCFDITSFDLVVNPYPAAQIQSLYGICPGETVSLTAGPGFDGYLWSNGATSQSIVVNTAGQYTVTVTKNYGSITCSATVTIDVVLSLPPAIDHIDTVDWTDTDNSITVYPSDPTVNYLYSLDNITFQSSNSFDGLIPGIYTVYVKDVGECGLIEEEVVLLSYPKYFTPNGDGYHDFWRIKFSEAEPNLMTYVYDRYGKLITGFRVDSPGWDGKLNGELLPSTDYWFVVVREDGKNYRGHFAMKR